MPGIETIVDANSLPVGSLVNPLDALRVQYNGVGPGPVSYDADRNLNGLGYSSGTISGGGTAGSTSITMGSAPTGLQPGAPVRLSGGGGSETVYTSV